MKYSKEFLETNARLKTLDKEALNDELNKMTFDELLAHRDYMIREELGEENLIPEERRQEQIKKLQQMTREPSAAEVKPIRIHSHRTAKRIVALAAAIVVMISVFMIAAVASKRDFSILNGIVRFEDGKVYIHFSDAGNFNSMTMTELEADLKAHGFENVKLPQYYYDGEWLTESVVYKADQDLLQANINVANKYEVHTVSIVFIFDLDFPKNTTLYGAEGGETIQNGDISVYLFDHGDGRCELNYYIKNVKYHIGAVSTVENMRGIANTIS